MAMSLSTRNKNFSRFIKDFLLWIFRPLSLAIFSLWQNFLTVAIVRRLLGIQLTTQEVLRILKVLKEKDNKNFLVFGLGNDSILWVLANRRGQTIFIEDNSRWAEKVKHSHPEINYFLVDYMADIKDWNLLINKPAELEMDFPDEVSSQRWDVVLVDAPNGFQNEGVPGRMKSIYAASKLVSENGHVFIHDCFRQVEQKYRDHYFSEEELIEIVGNLAYYSKKNNHN